MVTFDIVYKHYYSVALQAWVLPKNIRRKIENTSINGDIDHAADLPKTKNGDTNTGKATVVLLTSLSISTNPTATISTIGREGEYMRTAMDRGLAVPTSLLPLRQKDPGTMTTMVTHFGICFVYVAHNISLIFIWGVIDLPLPEEQLALPVAE